MNGWHEDPQPLVDRLNRVAEVVYGQANTKQVERTAIIAALGDMDEEDVEDALHNRFQLDHRVAASSLIIFQANTSHFVSLVTVMAALRRSRSPCCGFGDMNIASPCTTDLVNDGIEAYGRCVGHGGMPVDRGRAPDIKDCRCLLR
jgi:hypothetical protein